MSMIKRTGIDPRTGLPIDGRWVGRYWVPNIFSVRIPNNPPTNKWFDPKAPFSFQMGDGKLNKYLKEKADESKNI